MLRIFGAMEVLRLVLLPFAWLYAIVLRARHALYDTGLVHSERPAPPCIAVGNIALGGTGKTPHVELVLRTLIAQGSQEPLAGLAVLSRGYGRRSQGFAEVQLKDDAGQAGDEPLMLKRKFPGVRVFVDADRVGGVQKISKLMPKVRAVVLDDALQHRRLRASLNLVLTTWRRPWYRDHLLPAGRLRDLPYRARQADAVIVTKCPCRPTADEQQRYRRRLKLLPHQELFFSGMEHGMAEAVNAAAQDHSVDRSTAVLLLTGIADARALKDHLRPQCASLRHMAFGDHHAYSDADLTRVADVFHSFAAGPKMLVTTEKDAARLGAAMITGVLKDIPVAVIGVRAVILNEPYAFEALIRSHVTTHTTDR